MLGQESSRQYRSPLIPWKPWETTSPTALDPIGTPRRPFTDQKLPSAAFAWSGLPKTHDGNTSALPATQSLRAGLQYQGVPARDDRFEAAMVRYEQLKQEHETVLRTLGRGDSLATQLRDQASFYDHQYEEWNEVLTRDPFVLVLINGNSIFFEGNYVRLGEEGGRAAIIALQQMIRRWVASALECPLVQLSIRVYADLDRLSQSYLAAGTVTSAATVNNFARGLSLGDPLFDFIHVGAESDRDTKINAHLKLHLRNIQCKQIIIGCGRHTGVVDTLGNHQHNLDITNRITLIDSTFLVGEISKIPVKRRQFPGILREVNTVLDVDQNGVPTYSESTNLSKLSIAEGGVTASHLPANRGSSQASIATRHPLGHLRGVSSVPSETSETTGGIHGTSWSHVASAAKDLPFTDIPRPASEARTSTPGTAAAVRVNVQDQRVDLPMDFDHDRVARLKLLKLCNQYYIGKGCCHYNKGNDNCPHSHERELSKEDLKCLRAVARETVCRRGSSCRDPECIYGHHCPYPKATEGSMRGIGCINGPTCRFGPGMHGVDGRVRWVISSQSTES